MIIQTPELLEYKKINAKERAGRHLLVLVTYKNGIVLGNKFDKRQSQKGQWVKYINYATIVGGIGDLKDYKSVTRALSNFCQETKNLLGIHYITGHGIVQFLSDVMRHNFEEKSEGLAVNFLVTDSNTEGLFLWFINYDGRIKQLKNFAVAGGNEYVLPHALTEEEIANLPPHEMDMVKKIKQINPNRPITVPNQLFPRKDAIAYLEAQWKKNLTEKEAILLAKNTLFECDDTDMIELTIFNTKGFKPLYFKRKGVKKLPAETTPAKKAEKHQCESCPNGTCAEEIQK